MATATPPVPAPVLWLPPSTQTQRRVERPAPAQEAARLPTSEGVAGRAGDLMTTQSDLLESSLQAVILHGEAFLTAFYERLFTRYPPTRAFFPPTALLAQHKQPP